MFEAWGEIFTVPTDKGDIRNLTRSPAVADRDPAWSPDGQSIAYFSDESGEYELRIRDQTASARSAASTWAIRPRSSTAHLVARRQEDRLLPTSGCSCGIVDLDKGAPTRIDSDYFGGFGAQLSSTRSGRPTASGSPTPGSSGAGLHAVFLYSLDQGKSIQITDGMSDTLFPASTNGKYLYFTASTDTALSTSGLDMSSDAHRVSRSVYVAS